MLKIIANLFGINKSIQSLKKDFLSPRGEFQKGFKQVGRELINRAIDRYKTQYPTRSRGPDIKKAIRSSGFELVQDNNGDITIMMFDENILDLETQLPRTITTNQVFSLWRLLSEGWGTAIGHGDTKGYPLYVIIQTSAVADQFVGGKIGKSAPWPDLVDLENEGVRVIRHPGAKGKEWFLRNGNIFFRDKRLIQRSIDEILNKIIKNAGLN